jgi:molybdopterin-synthase adenylyltransferase
MGVSKVYVLSDAIARYLASGAPSGLGWAVVRDTQPNGLPDVMHLFDVGELSQSIVPPWIIPFRWDTDIQLHDEALQTAQWGVFLHLTSDTLKNGSVPVDLKWNSHKHAADLVIVDAKNDAFSRGAAVLETSILHEKEALCIGLGSGGSAIANELARAGVGRFILWDNDRLEAHNVGRHLCTLRDIGRLKVRAVAEHILAINPQATIEMIADDVMEHREPGGKLELSITRADYVVVGTDNNRSRYAINRTAWRLGKPAIYGRAYHRACGGDVIHVRPDKKMPCYECHVGAAEVPEEISSARNAEEISYSDHPVLPEPGLNMDIAPIGNLMARIVIANLCIGQSRALSVVAGELDAPKYFWASRREPPFASWPEMGKTYETLAILRWYGASVRNSEECTTCGVEK